MIHFSIIIPTLNAAGTLTEALKSVAKQTTRNFEILLQDGGSTDATLEVASKFQKKFGRRLRIIQRADTGVYDAMNQALTVARGRWIYFLGADDVLLKRDVLERVTDEIRRRPHCQFLYGNVIMLSTRNRYAGPFDWDNLLMKNICHQAIFYRRGVFREIGKYNLDYPELADWDLNIRCFLSERLEIHYLDCVIARYNDLSGVSFQNTDTGFYEKREILKLQQAPKSAAKKSFFVRCWRRIENWIEGL